MTDTDRVYEWFNQERGITKATLDAFGVSIADNGDVTLVYPNGEKVRPNPTRPLGDRPRFAFTKGQAPALYRAVNNRDPHGVAFLCEGETDTMRLWQEIEAANVKADVFGIGGLHTWKREFADELAPYSKVFVVLDNDADYKVAATVDHVWLHQIRHDLGPKAKRIQLPAGVKDLCEFFTFYDMDTLRDLSRGTQSRFRPLDLTREPPPVDWLLDGLIAKADVNLFAGGEGLGKSMISMGLTVAVADGWTSFLGLPVYHQGRILYVDEENPEDVVFQRLNRMGLKNTQNVRYLWNNGIRLDKNPDDFLAEVYDFQPELVVLDSLSRLHSLEENDMGSIGPLFNNVLKPMARESGAAVFMIHHHDKGGNGPRGSGDITASVDCVINCYPGAQNGEMNVQLRKSRRRLGGDQMKVRIIDRPDGALALDAVNYGEVSL